jgi:hypothetical protein
MVAPLEAVQHAAPIRVARTFRPLLLLATLAGCCATACSAANPCPPGTHPNLSEDRCAPSLEHGPDHSTGDDGGIDAGNIGITDEDDAGAADAGAADANVAEMDAADMDAADADAIDASACDGVSCSEHASCRVSVGEPQCSCDEGYSGPAAFCVKDLCYQLCDGDPAADCTRLSIDEAMCNCPPGFRGDGVGAAGCAPYLTQLHARPGAVEIREKEAKVYIAPWREEVEWQVFASAPSRIELGANVLEAGARSMLPAPPDGPLDLTVSAGGATSRYALTVERRPGESYLIHTPWSENDFMGFAVAISGDYLAVSIPNEDGEPGNQNTDECINSGAVLVYSRGAGEDPDWTHPEYVKADPCVTNAYFGYSVALQGEWLAVGAYLEGVRPADGARLNHAGAVYMFKRNALGKWEQKARLISSMPAANETFGKSLSLEGDRLVVGAPHEDTSEYVPAPGAVYVFARDASDSWEFERRLLGSHAQPYDLFGRSVALSGDLLAVGASNTDVDGIIDAGATYVLRRDASGSFSEVAYLTDPDAGTYHLFGTVVALQGTHLAVASPHETIIGTFTPDTDAPQSGATYVYEVAGENVQFVDELSDVAAAGDESPSRSLAFAGDWLAIGDVQRLSGGGGRMYLFQRGDDEHWHELTTLAASNARSNDQFGSSVAVENGRILVGAIRHDGPDQTPLQQGAAYILE